MLPYKLVQCRSSSESSTSLWDHRPAAGSEMTTLQFLSNKHPHFVINKNIIRSGYSLLNSNRNFSGIFYGNIIYDNDELMLCVKEVASESNGSKSSYKLMAPTYFTRNSKEVHALQKDSCGKELFDDLEHCLEEWNGTNASLSFTNFVKIQFHCVYGEKRKMTVPFGLQILMVCLATVVHAIPINPLKILPTALYKGLCDKNCNAFLYNEPKSGYLTMDNFHRLLHILESDPKASSLPLVGIWISGVNNLHHPYVWSACIRYTSLLNSKKICQPPDPYLLLFYDARLHQPQFYECIVPDILNGSPPKGLAYFGRISSAFDDDDNSDRMEDVHIWLERTDDDLIKESSYTIHNLSKRVTTPLQRLSFSSPTTKDSSSLSSSSSKQSSAVSDLSPSKETVDKSNDDFPPTVPSFPVTSPQFPSDIYRVLVDQQQRLNSLQEQLETLLQSRTSALELYDAKSKLSSDEELRQSKKLDAVEKSNMASVSTMTSFQWPVTARLDDACKKCTCRERESVLRSNTAVSDGVEESAVKESVEDYQSPEQIRRDAIDFSWDKPNGSLENWHLPAVSNLSTSRPSTLIIDLEEYAHSIASSNQVSCMPNINLATSKLFLTGDKDNKDTTFYGNLLQRIETVLSHQNMENGYTVIHAHKLYRFRNRQPFDSLFLPQLNYMSLQLSDIDCDKSKEFHVLARRYIKDKVDNVRSTNDDLAKSKSNMELSFATVQYLKKYKL